MIDMSLSIILIANGRGNKCAAIYPHIWFTPMLGQLFSETTNRLTAEVVTPRKRTTSAPG
jgi:hypothetical protein